MREVAVNTQGKPRECASRTGNVSPLWPSTASRARPAPTNPLAAVSSGHRAYVPHECGRPLGRFCRKSDHGGQDFFSYHLGTRFSIGDEVLVELTQTWKNCHNGCEIQKFVGSCIMICIY